MVDVMQHTAVSSRQIVPGIRLLSRRRRPEASPFAVSSEPVRSPPVFPLSLLSSLSLMSPLSLLSSLSLMSPLSLLSSLSLLSFLTLSGKRLPKRLLRKRTTSSTAELNRVASISLVRSCLLSQIFVKYHFPFSCTGRKQNRIKRTVHVSESKVPRVNAALSFSSTTSAVIQAHRRIGM